MGFPIGTARFEYTGPTTVNLQAPLREISPVEGRPSTDSIAVDGITREVITFAVKWSQVSGVLRYIDNPRQVLDLLIFGAEGGTLNYHEATAAPAIPCILILPKRESIELLPDRDFGKLGRYEVNIVLRRDDGGNFDALLD